jgi:hypothetical protein
MGRVTPLATGPSVGDTVGMMKRLTAVMLGLVASVGAGCCGREVPRGEAFREFWLSTTTTDVRVRPMVSEDPQAAPDARDAVLRVGTKYAVELIASVNVDVPAGASAWLEARLVTSRVVTGAEDLFSPWFVLATYGAAAGVKPPLVAADGIVVDIDTLRFPPRYQSAEVRVRTTSAGTVVRRIDVTTTARGVRPTEEKIEQGGEAILRGLDLPVPFLSQKTSRDELSGRLCSPTSLAMVLNYHGAACAVEGTAAAAYDPAHDIYGNWPRNVQAAHERDVSGMLTRFGSWTSVEETLAKGRPIIASIVVEPGELRGAPYASTDGHLIVIRGVDERGDLLVNDPAAGTAETGRLTYRRQDMERVWFENTKGTAYVLEPRVRREGE